MHTCVQLREACQRQDADVGLQLTHTAKLAVANLDQHFQHFMVLLQ